MINSYPVTKLEPEVAREAFQKVNEAGMRENVADEDVVNEAVIRENVADEDVVNEAGMRENVADEDAKCGDGTSIRYSIPAGVPSDAEIKALSSDVSFLSHDHLVFIFSRGRVFCILYRVCKLPKLGNKIIHVML